MNYYTDYPALILITLAVFAFIAGFIDAVAGGGGLIQLPALLIHFPEKPIPVLFGTNKIAALSGTSFAAYRYSKSIRFDKRLLIITIISSALASFTGAKAVNYVDVHILRPVVLAALIVIAIYTIINKQLGHRQTKILSRTWQFIYGALLGLTIGFYDGFFGPGTGSFLILGFVTLMGFDFLHASAYAKIINGVTNISALAVFVWHKQFLPEIAIVMAVFNIVGSLMGSRMAIKRGNQFVRVVFIAIVFLLIARYGYDVGKVHGWF